MASYTTPDLIDDYLGVTFTAEQEAQALLVADAVTTWIDHRTGRTWQSSGTVLDEQHLVTGTTVYLDAPPVVSVELVELWATVRDWQAIPDTNWELTDPAHGTITLIGGYDGETVRVDYTSDATAPPADIALAATILAAQIMAPTLAPGTAGLESISVGQNDLTVRFAGASGAESAQQLYAGRVIDSYRRVVLA